MANGNLNKNRTAHSFPPVVRHNCKLPRHIAESRKRCNVNPQPQTATLQCLPLCRHANGEIGEVARQSRRG